MDRASGLRGEVLKIVTEAADILGFEPVLTLQGPIDSLVPDGARPDLLAAALEELALDPARRARMAAAARERGRQYDIVHAVRRIEDIYDRLTR